ncbi:right-handed parallel beta-helix repeat-containing protein [Pyrobaculum ferrireducens]|uniref:right-handed parallel beta-helix repeat-containing protein n=1 Tax=Pyrobaculum ferrireducens TaxID=1104324 RepID=UPI0011E508FD|nr:NosD domain-containing protein [Pyrobaculum ferrireducens]
MILCSYGVCMWDVLRGWGVLGFFVAWISVLLGSALAAAALVVSQSNVAVVVNVTGGMGPVELGGGLFATYKVRPADFCVVVQNAANVTLLVREVRCSAGVLVVNSTDVKIYGGLVEGNPSLPVYRRGAGIYIYNSTNVSVVGVELRYFHDGVYVERSRGVYIAGVLVGDSRYGVHVMFSRDVGLANVTARGNYVGAAVMYTQNAEVSRCKFVENINWSEGYGLFIADVSGGVFKDNYVAGNVHGVYLLVMGGWGNATSIKIAGNTVRENYVGLTYRGAPSPGVKIINNTFVGNAVPAIYVDIFLAGGSLNGVVVMGNTWQGHASHRPYIYRSYFAEALAKTDFLIAPLSSSPARFLVDSLAVGNVAFIDPQPKPQRGEVGQLHLALAAAALLLVLLARR